MAIDLNARMEHTWDVLTIHAVVWPCGQLDVERLTEACLSIVRSAHPGSYIARQVGRVAAEAGLTSDELLRRRRAEFVRVVDHRSRDEFVDLVCARTHDRHGLPFECTVTDGGLGLSYSHELGDGHVLNGFLLALFTAYRRGRPTTVAVPTRVVTDRELVGALSRAFVRRPGSVAGTVSAVLRRARRRRSAVAGTDHRTVEPVRREMVVVTEEEMAAVDAWRRRLPSKPSSTVALLWLVSRALRAHGYPDPQPWQVMANLRGASYGRDWSTVGGSLVGRALIDVDRDTDAAAVTDQIRDQTRGPDLLAQHLLKMARGLGRSDEQSRRDTGAPARPIGTPPGLSWSDLGRHADGGYAPLIPTRAADGSRVRPEVLVFTYPYEQGLGMIVNWMNGGALLMIAFGASPVDGSVDDLLATLRGGVSRLLPAEPARRT